MGLLLIVFWIYCAALHGIGPHRTALDFLDTNPSFFLPKVVFFFFFYYIYPLLGHKVQKLQCHTMPTNAILCEPANPTPNAKSSHTFIPLSPTTCPSRAQKRISQPGKPPSRPKPRSSPSQAPGKTWPRPIQLSVPRPSPIQTKVPGPRLYHFPMTLSDLTTLGSHQGVILSPTPGPNLKAPRQARKSPGKPHPQIQYPRKIQHIQYFQLQSNQSRAMLLLDHKSTQFPNSRRKPWPLSTNPRNRSWKKMRTNFSLRSHKPKSCAGTRTHSSSPTPSARASPRKGTRSWSFSRTAQQDLFG